MKSSKVAKTTMTLAMTFGLTVSLTRITEAQLSTVAKWKNRKAYNEGLDNDWWKNVKAAYKKPTMSNEDALRFLLTIGATQ